MEVTPRIRDRSHVWYRSEWKSQWMYSTYCYSKCWKWPHGYVTEVTYVIGQSGSHSECTVLTVTVSVEVTPRTCDRGHVLYRSEWKSQWMYSTYCYSKCWKWPHGYVTEVTYYTGQSGSHSECTVLTATVSVGSDPTDTWQKSRTPHHVFYVLFFLASSTEQHLSFTWTQQFFPQHLYFNQNFVYISFPPCLIAPPSITASLISFP
jgi:hypothetical protein